MFRTSLFYIGFFLIFILFSEEFNNLLKYVRSMVKIYPILKLIVYPIAMLLAAVFLIIIGNSLISLITSIKFSYE